MATLADAIRQVARIGQTPARSEAAALHFEQGEISQVGGTGDLTVSVSGRSVFAKAVTDEPYRVGAKVWVSESSEGWIVHGGVR